MVLLKQPEVREEGWGVETSASINKRLEVFLWSDQSRITSPILIS